MLQFFNFGSYGSGRSKMLAVGRHSSASCKHTWFSGKKADGGLRWGAWVKLINLAIPESSHVDCPQKK